MTQTGKPGTFAAMAAEVESVLPALRELDGALARLADVKREEEAVADHIEALKNDESQALLSCTERIRDAEAERDRRIARAEQECILRNAEAKERHAQWMVSAKAERAIEEAEEVRRKASLDALHTEIELKQAALVDTERRLSAARQAFKAALES